MLMSLLCRQCLVSLTPPIVTVDRNISLLIMMTIYSERIESGRFFSGVGVVTIRHFILSLNNCILHLHCKR